MKKDLIELQKGVKAACVVIEDRDYINLENKVTMSANIDDVYLFGCKLENPIFKDKIEYLSNNGNLGYFIIRQIDELSEKEQNKYISLVKDREFQGYKIPDNIIIVFTVQEKENLKKISKELYHFCVIAF